MSENDSEQMVYRRRHTGFKEDWAQAMRLPAFRTALRIGGGFVALCLFWAASVLMDRRIEMSAVGLNIWSSDISESMAQISNEPERWTSWGVLGYDTTATHEMLYLVPPTEVRVYWEAAEGSFDRMVPVEGIPAPPVSKYSATPLLYELDSRCGRARVSWKKDMDEVWIVRPEKPIKHDCSSYKDRPTPKEAGPLPTWR